MIWINRENIQHLRGFAHKYDTLQDAFLHKTSLAKFTIPYNDPRFWPMANVFSFVIKPIISTEFADTECDTTDKVNEDCFAEHLQNLLGCKLPWDVGLRSSEYLE